MANEIISSEVPPDEMEKLLDDVENFMNGQ
jgi:hypothetical protein